MSDCLLFFLMCLCMRKFNSVFVLPVIPYQAVRPKPKIFVRLFWITTHDLSAAGKPRKIWGSWIWLGNTSPDLLSQFGIRPRCVCMRAQFSHARIPKLGLCVCFMPPQSHSHTDLFTPPWKWSRPRRQTRLTRGRATLEPSFSHINSFLHGTVLQPLWHAT